MKISGKEIVVFILIFIGLQFGQTTVSSAQERKGVKISIAHCSGELRKVHISKKVSQNVVKGENENKTENKLIVYEKEYKETCVQADKAGGVQRLFLNVIKSRRRKGKSDDLNAQIMKDSDEGMSVVLTGDELLKYRKLQPDFGLILPEDSVSVGETWQPDETQMTQLFDKKIQEGNTVVYKLLELKEDKTDDTLYAWIERELMLKFVVPSENNSIESAGVEKTRTTYRIDVKQKRIVSISESQVLIMNVSEGTKPQIVMVVATETSYEYEKVKMFSPKIIPEADVEQTERAFMNFDLKMLVTSKKDKTQLVTTQTNESDKIYRRTATKLDGYEVLEYSLCCDYDRTIETHTSLVGKKSQEVKTSQIENKKFAVHNLPDGKKRIIDESGIDVSDKIVLPENTQTGTKLNLPKFPIPIGYVWNVESVDSVSILASMFKEIKIKNISAQIEFTKVFKDMSNRAVSEFRLDIAVVGETKEYGRLIFAISVFNHLDLERNRILKIFTPSSKKSDTVLRLHFENENIIIDSIGTMQINTEYSYSNEKKATEIVGNWILLDRDSGNKKDGYELQFFESGKLVYVHPHINGKDTLTDHGIWRMEKDILTVKFGGEKDIFRFKIENNELILTKILRTTDSTNVFPWRVGQNDKYVKSVE